MGFASGGADFFFFWYVLNIYFVLTPFFFSLSLII